MNVMDDAQAQAPVDYRSMFPLANRCVYLNSNTTGAVPSSAELVLEDYWRTIEHWGDTVWRRWWSDLERHTVEIAALLGAPPGSVVCDTNLATLFSRVMSCFDFRARPRVVTSDLEFPSVPFVLRAFGRYGCAVTTVRSVDGLTIGAEQIAEAIDERTQLVCVSHATFASGALIDMAPIVRRAREFGALVALDVYQSVGVVPIDVAALDVDFVLGGAHKWLCGSQESAFLYIRPALLPFLEPAATGWAASLDPFTARPVSQLADDARRFGSGTPAVLPSLMSRPGLRIVRAIGVEAIRARSLARTDRIIARADAAGLHVATPRPHDRRAGIVSLRFRGDAEISRTLIASGFVCSHYDGVRVAPHFYNTDEEIDRFMDELIRLAGNRT
jgi:selenocysteine lyase/cysteine desulfurase